MCIGNSDLHYQYLYISLSMVQFEMSYPIGVQECIIAIGIDMVIQNSMNAVYIQLSVDHAINSDMLIIQKVVQFIKYTKKSPDVHVFFEQSRISDHAKIENRLNQHKLTRLFWRQSTLFVV